MQNRKIKKEHQKTAEENTVHNEQQPIGQLPEGVKQLLSRKYLNSTDSFSLFRAAPMLFQSVPNDIKNFADHPLKNLLSHAALGEWEQAEAIWKKDPSLLTIPGTVYHPNRHYKEGQDPTDIPSEMSLGRYKYVDCTVWQIALMNEEFKEADLMGQHMTAEEKQKQFLAIFPDGKMQHPQDLAVAKELLQMLLNAVIADPRIHVDYLDRMNIATRNILSALRNYIKPKPEHKTGLVLDPNIYHAAQMLHDDNFSQFSHWGVREFWCTRVEEMIASALGTGYLRPHAQGIEKEPHHRRGCISPSGSTYFAFRFRHNVAPGFNFFITYDGIAESPAVRPCMGRPATAQSFKKHMEQTQEQGKAYMDAFARQDVGMSNR